MTFLSVVCLSVMVMRTRLLLQTPRPQAVPIRVRVTRWP
jgi:hypothetical protein